MNQGMTISHFWLPPDFDKSAFIRAFLAHFNGGKAKHCPLVPDAHPRQVPDGSQLIELEVPTARMGEYQPFLQLFAAERGYDLNLFPNTAGFGFSHSG